MPLFHYLKRAGGNVPYPSYPGSLCRSESGPSQVSKLSFHNAKRGEGGDPLPGAWRRALESSQRRRSHSANSPAPRAACCRPARSREKREGTSGGKVGPGWGCLESWAALTSLGAQFGIQRFKKRACERRCCCTQLRPPAAATRTATAATASRAAPGASVAATCSAIPAELLLCAPGGGQERGAQCYRRRQSFRSRRSAAWRATVHNSPGVALGWRLARGSLPWAPWTPPASACSCPCLCCCS